MNTAAIRANRRKLLILAFLVLLCAAGYMLVEVNFSMISISRCGIEVLFINFFFLANKRLLSHMFRCPDSEFSPPVSHFPPRCPFGNSRR